MVHLGFYIFMLMGICLIIKADLQNQLDEGKYTAVKHEISETQNSSMGYVFFRSLPDKGSGSGSSRRVFGGSAAELDEFPVVCALLDRFWSVRCSATVIGTNWALTAAHCVTPWLVYVKYNTRRPSSAVGNYATIACMYRHPSYEVQQRDRGGGMDVVLLHNDVGLVRTKEQMMVKAGTTMLNELRRFNSFDLFNKEVKVLGFGRTERSIFGEELFSVGLQLVHCLREDWSYCVCGVASGSNSRGVCSGDSGGPVVYRGVLVGVTSMGPIECAQTGASTPLGLTSVFTSLYQYSDVINDTILDTETALRMRKFSSASPILVSCKLLFAMFLVLPTR